MICSCAPEPAAKFYTERRKLNWKAPVVNVFFGKSPKVPELAGQEAVEGVYFTTIFRDFSSTARPMQQALQVLKNTIRKKSLMHFTCGALLGLKWLPKL